MEIHNHQDKIKFNVGGRIFETTATTLSNAGRDSYFGALLDQNWNLSSSSDQIHFLDRNPEAFAVLLDLLRSNDLSSSSSSSVPDRLLYREAAFYGLLPLVRSAKWGPLDPDRLKYSNSVFGTAPGDATALRASPEGGAAVAHGSLVHVYDWTMEHRPPVNMSYRRVNDVSWADERFLAVSVCEQRAEQANASGGSIGLFCAETGAARQVFSVVHSGERKRFSAGALAFDGGRLFASCRGRSEEYGVGVWDWTGATSGDQADFFYEATDGNGGWPLGEADRLEWVPSRGGLLAATLFPRRDDCFVSLLDLRQRTIAWRWSDAGGGGGAGDERRVRDAVAGEDGNSVCVVNEFEDLGFIDLRYSGSNSGSGVGGGGVRWCSRSRLMTAAATKRKAFLAAEEEPCYPKLACHGGRIFTSMNDSVSVFSGPEWVLTTRLRGSRGGSICDFSIGGDRLFALHSEENVFDVWETPPTAVF